VAIWLILLSVFIPASVQNEAQFNGDYAQIGAFKISIINNDGPPVLYEATRYPNLGAQVGEILNAHYFPGINLYEAGNYREAFQQLTYVIDRPTYIDGNPNQILYLTTAYYVRGSIFLYHAAGAGRLTLARQDFQTAIQLNEKNYPAYLELSRVFSTAGLREESAAVLRHLIELNPDKETLEKAERELVTVTSESK